MWKFYVMLLNWSNKCLIIEGTFLVKLPMFCTIFIGISSLLSFYSLLYYTLYYYIYMTNTNFTKSNFFVYYFSIFLQIYNLSILFTRLQLYIILVLRILLLKRFVCLPSSYDSYLFTSFHICCSISEFSCLFFERWSLFKFVDDN